MTAWEKMMEELRNPPTPKPFKLIIPMHWVQNNHICKEYAEQLIKNDQAILDQYVTGNWKAPLDRISKTGPTKPV